MTITYALMEKLEDVCEKEPHRAQVIKKAAAKKLIKDASGKVVGITYEVDGTTKEAYGPVVIATGGYAADFTETSLLKKYRCVLCFSQLLLRKK
jgi:aspartate oxidase